MNQNPSTKVTCPKCEKPVVMRAKIQKCNNCGLEISLMPAHRLIGNDSERVAEYLCSIGASDKKFYQLMRAVVPLRYRMFAPEIIQKVDTQFDTT